MIWKVISNDRLVFHWRLESERLSKSTEAVSQWPNRTNRGFLKPMNWEDQTMVHDDSKQPGSSLAPLTVASDVKFAGKCSEQSPTTPSVLESFTASPRHTEAPEPPDPSSSPGVLTKTSKLTVSQMLFSSNNLFSSVVHFKPQSFFLFEKAVYRFSASLQLKVQTL